MSHFHSRTCLLKVTCAVSIAVFGGTDALLAAAGGQNEPVPTNFEIIERLSTEAAEELAAGIEFIPKDAVVFLSKTKGAGDADFIIESALLGRMKSGGLRVTLVEPKPGASAVDSSGYRLSYHVVRLTISYPRISRKWLLGSKEVDRSARADISARLVDRETGEVVWMGESHRGYDDTIGYGALESVEDAQYEFTRPPRDEMRLSRFIEPIIVSGIVIGLVYLFFSNQGSD